MFSDGTDYVLVLIQQKYLLNIPLICSYNSNIFMILFFPKNISWHFNISADPDQMPHYVLSGLALHCLVMSFCMNTLGKYSMSHAKSEGPEQTAHL